MMIVCHLHLIEVIKMMERLVKDMGFYVFEMYRDMLGVVAKCFEVVQV